jgi:hypothetical protein
LAIACASELLKVQSAVQNFNAEIQLPEEEEEEEDK